MAISPETNANTTAAIKYFRSGPAHFNINLIGLFMQTPCTIVVPKRSVTGNGDAAIRGRSPIFSLTELTVYDIIRNVVIDNIVIDEKGSGCEAG